MQTINSTTIRPKRVILTTGALLLILGASVPLYEMIHHQAMIWLNGGTWCAQFAPDGTEQIKYGTKDCGL